jgi:hypothetical protein
MRQLKNKMTYNEKLRIMRGFVEENIYSVEDFCYAFDVELDDLVAALPDKLVKGYNKHYQGVVDEEDTDYSDPLLFEDE